MARPSSSQQAFLHHLRGRVLAKMSHLGLLDDQQEAFLREVPLGVLRRNATQRHGVTRWKRRGHLLTLETVDLHPRLLNESWEDYGSFVMFHEFLHAMGWRAHDNDFRTLEGRWPDTEASSRGAHFTSTLRLEQATWIWHCPRCDGRFPRKKRSNGRYQCRTCKTTLVDLQPPSLG